jgi:hypothetical protein
VKHLRHFLDRSLPVMGRAARSRATSIGGSRPVVLFQTMNPQHPGEGGS